MSNEVIEILFSRLHDAEVLLIAWRVIFTAYQYPECVKMLANKILWTMINKEIHFPLLIITNSTWNSLIFKDCCHPTIKVLFSFMHKH